MQIVALETRQLAGVQALNSHQKQVATTQMKRSLVPGNMRSDFQG